MACSPRHRPEKWRGSRRNTFKLADPSFLLSFLSRPPREEPTQEPNGSAHPRDEGIRSVLLYTREAGAAPQDGGTDLRQGEVEEDSDPKELNRKSGDFSSGHLFLGSHVESNEGFQGSTGDSLGGTRTSRVFGWQGGSARLSRFREGAFRVPRRLLMRPDLT